MLKFINGRGNQTLECPSEFQGYKCANPYIMQKPIIFGNDKKYTFNHKGLAFPCGKCIYCRSRKRKQWTTRLNFEAMRHNNNSFITLTYKEYHPIIENELFQKSRSLDYTDIQKFHKHLKMNVKRARMQQYKHFNAGEYGNLNTQRAHWHLINFGMQTNDTTKKWIEKIWKYGDINDIQEIIDSRGVASYVSKYVVKKVAEDNKDGRTPPMHHGSTGLGWEVARALLLKPAKESFREFGDFNHIVFNGKIVILDRYLKNKLAQELKIKDELTANGLLRLESYMKECQALYEFQAIKTENDKIDDLPFYAYYKQKDLNNLNDSHLHYLRKIWHYRHKAKAEQAYKYFKLQELRKSTLKNAL